MSTNLYKLIIKLDIKLIVVEKCNHKLCKNLYSNDIIRLTFTLQYAITAYNLKNSVRQNNIPNL